MDDTFPPTTQLLEIFRRIQEGDSQAREELFGGVARRLERLARRMLRRFPRVARMEDTGDVLQKALARLLAALRETTVSSSRQFLALASEMVRRELLDLARYYGRGRRAGRFAQPEEYSSSILALDRLPQPEEDPDDLERWAEFHERVESLPEEEREVVQLHFYQGWTFEEAARFLNSNARRVGRLWRKALLRLKNPPHDASDRPNRQT